MSLDLQKEYYTQYAKDKGYEFVKLYYDEGLTATSSNRTDFLNMLYDAGLDYKVNGNRVIFEESEREPMFEWIIIKDVDRFARNTNTIDIVRDLDLKDVHIIFENLNFSTKDNDWEMRMNLFLTFSQQESLDKSRKLRDSYLKRANKGEFFMSTNLFGYGKVEGKKEHYIIEDEAKVVRMIFDYYTLDKIGSYEIADLLNEQGYHTKQGRTWNGNSVTRVLKNEKYKGQVIQNRYGKTSITGSHKRVINPKNEWIIHDDAIPAIVSKEQFDEAQEIRASRTVSTVAKDSSKRQVRGRKVIKNVFYQKIWCGKCGSDYIRHTSIDIIRGEKQTKYFYGCRKRTNQQRRATKCMNRGISHNVLEREIIKLSKRKNLIDFDDESLAREEIALKEKLQQVDDLISNAEQHKKETDNKIDEINKQIGNLFNTLASGVSDTITKMTQGKIEELEKEITNLEARKTEFDEIELEHKKKMYQRKFDEILKVSNKADYTFDEILEQIYKIEILDDKKVVIQFFVPTLQSDDDSAKRVVSYMFER